MVSIPTLKVLCLPYVDPAIADVPDPIHGKDVCRVSIRLVGHLCRGLRGRWSSFAAPCLLAGPNGVERSDGNVLPAWALLEPNIGNGALILVLQERESAVGVDLH
jgi:hypothetical protein